ncbi:sensor histidine kinase [Desulfitobacterium chlororespirans]|uniref:histidine kinase n=1 Tax=Desulfitobacterium chlororespirans DSM 11544 TaxID=1121395 RepID=A0A1M7RU04_9FIRM|nr:HAMP domain-containing sensor histidine kinase [Desulfitobacterium chlororespirans]SHN49731.1 Signal transduction histidine kinase [Desulfitobacterium chlororespirans DSM 11544]
MRSSLLNGLVVLLIGIGIAAGALYINYRQVDLPASGIADFSEQTVYRLGDFSHSGNALYEAELLLSGTDPSNNTALIFVNFTDFRVYLDESLLYDGLGMIPASKAVVCPLPEEGRDLAHLKLTVVTEHWPFLGNVYWGREAPCQSFVDTYNALRVFSFGLLTAMFLYGFSLYINKRNERYLLDFIFYTATMCLWFIWESGFAIPPLEFDIGRNIFNTLTLMLSLRLTLRILSPDCDGWIHKVFSAPGIAAATGLFVIIHIVSPGSIANITGLFFSTSLVIVVYHCLKYHGGSLHLLIGLVIMHELRFINRQPLLTESFYTSAISGTPVYELPFILMFMLVVNKKYSNKFKDYEQLNISLRESNNYLDHMVEQRTAHIKKAQEQRHNLMLNVFHDLRSPLFIMKGYLDNLDLSRPDIHKQLATIKGRLDFIIHLSEDLFLTAKLEGRHLMFVEENLDLSQSIQTLADASRLVAEEKGIELVCKIEPPPGYVWGDPYRIEQALQNIVHNAIHYTPSGGTVDLMIQYDELHATILVRDTGKGISEEELPKVFTRYYRAGKPDKSASSGLGLSIAYEIITQQRGSIQVESIVGQGTLFRVSFPYSKSGLRRTDDD